MIEARWEPILPVLREFQSSLRSKGSALRIVSACDRRWSEQRYQQERKTGIYRKYGVYLIFNPLEILEYVGLAMNAFDDRIWSHDSYVNRQYTDVVAFDHTFYFLAPALEFFLIVRLQPPKNSQYKGYTIPESAI